LKKITCTTNIFLLKGEIKFQEIQHLHEIFLWCFYIFGKNYKVGLEFRALIEQHVTWFIYKQGISLFTIAEKSERTDFPYVCFYLSIHFLCTVLLSHHLTYYVYHFLQFFFLPPNPMRRSWYWKVVLVICMIYEIVIWVGLRK